MNNLNKMEVFRDCGFLGLPDMPSINFVGYDKVMEKCYQAGHKSAQYQEASRVSGAIYDFAGFLTTLDTPLVVSRYNEASPMVDLIKQFLSKRGIDKVISDVHHWDDTYKKVKDLETANARLFERNHELQVDNEESLKEVEEYSKRCDELRRGIAEHAKAYTIQKDTIEMCKQEIDYLHGCLGDRDRALLNLQNSVVGTLENAPKSKFVITVEEF